MAIGRRTRLGALAGLLLPVACGGGRETPATGEVLYRRHCAACHGERGVGDGPLAGALRRPPVDLTRIAEREGGRFDEARVMAVIDGRRAVAEHGPREMPVWGAVFAEELEGDRHAAYTTLLHARALTDYLRSLQR